MTGLIIDLQNVSYRRNGHMILKNIDWQVEAGEHWIILGLNGCGKTTLISTLAGLDVPTMGKVLFEGKSTMELDRDLYRRRDVAVIYQNYNLFPLLTVMENVLYPMQLQRKPRKEAKALAEQSLRSVGLDEGYWKRLPAMLSGGEQQRVAIARAIAGGQKIILADEPTGNLDGENSDLVMKTFQRLAHEEGYCVIIVTHDPQIADESDVIIRMESGKIV